ncbi:MAG TPA: dynamin family protein [Acidimicrobiales bacterium]|nr:dynamin family protein [Acidimicrobiales bacterium]
MTTTEAPTGGLINELMSLLAQARDTAPDHDARDAVDEVAGRLSEPLRVAIAGKVKAGKSTLLNALVGDHLAPTDARECTRVVTWYRDAHTYRVEAYGKDGTVRQCPFRRRDDQLEIDLGGTPAEDLDRLVVWWPSASLSEVTLIDTPGIGSISTDLSARTYTFLTADEEEPAAADAVLYLVRHLHNTDVRFLEAFHDDDLAHSTPVNAVGVLSRADEIGACRLDAMDSARRVAARYGHDPRIRQLCRSVIPVAGLVAQAGATLREDEFRALSTLVGPGRPDPAELALTADRFVAPDAAVDVDADGRWRLLGRLGLYGVRLALDLLARHTVTSGPELAGRLVQASGVADLQWTLHVQLIGRSQPLKARSALAALSSLLASRSWPQSDRLATRAEMIASSAHEIAEVRLLTELWLGELVLRDEAQADELERLLGGRGVTPTERLALPPDAGFGDLSAAALEARHRWSQTAEHPMSSMAVKAAARGAVRTCEGILAWLTAGQARRPPDET